MFFTVKKIDSKLKIQSWTKAIFANHIQINIIQYFVEYCERSYMKMQEADYCDVSDLPRYILANKICCYTVVHIVQNDVTNRTKLLFLIHISLLVKKTYR